MMPFRWFHLYAVVWLVATLLGAFGTWMARRLAPRFGLWDKPHSEHHKNHTRPTPVAGGLGMWFGWVGTILGGFLVIWLLRDSLPTKLQETLQGLDAARRPLAVLMGGATTLMLMGLRDDKWPMKASSKLLGQIVVAAVTAFLGPRILSGFSPFWVSWFLTAFWYVSVMNAFNFFDNMDGLAGGSGFLALFFLFLISALRGQYFVSFFLAAIGGATLGFLFHNRPPASIFMGDCGSHFWGISSQ